MQTVIYPFGTLTCANKYMTNPIEFDSSVDKSKLKDFLDDLEHILNKKVSTDEVLQDIDS